MPNAIDRRSAADAIGRLRLAGTEARLRPLLNDRDPDCVRSAALALAAIGDQAAVPMIRRALADAHFVETRCDLAKALALLRCADGIPLLIAGLDHQDDLVRERFFETLFAVTGLHLGFDPLAPRPQRLEAIARLSAFWTAEGGADKLRKPYTPSQRAHRHAWGLVEKLGDADPGKDEPRVRELVGMGSNAVPALVLGLKFPAGFDARRAQILNCLAQIRNKDAAPFVAAALRDPVVGVASWACFALAYIKDEATLPALRYYHADLLSRASAGTIPEQAGPVDALVARSAATRLILGDQTARNELVNLLLSPEASARKLAHDTLLEVYEERHDYDPDGTPDARRAAARRWQKGDKTE